jgi:hypothetical protein
MIPAGARIVADGIQRQDLVQMVQGLDAVVEQSYELALLDDDGVGILLEHEGQIPKSLGVLSVHRLFLSAKAQRAKQSKAIRIPTDLLVVSDFIARTVMAVNAHTIRLVPLAVVKVNAVAGIEGSPDSLALPVAAVALVKALLMAALKANVVFVHDFTQKSMRANPMMNMTNTASQTMRRVTARLRSRERVS